MDLDKISELIKSKRKEKGLTQLELAEKLNVTEKAISRWETGRGTPDISLLIPLSKALDLDVSEILNGKESKKEEKNIQEIINYIEINKKSKNKYIVPLFIGLYAVLLFLYLGYLKIEYSIESGHTYLGEIIINVFFAFGIWFINRLIANNYYDKKEDKEKINRITNIMLLILYSIMFINLTIFGRTIYGEIRYNIIPFKSIIDYIVNFNWYDFRINIIGNIIILMPFQFLIMKIYKIKNLKQNLLFELLFVFLIELLQYITHTGVFDIDDIILNVFGMTTIYLLFANNKFNIKKSLKLIIPVFVVIGILFGVTKYNSYVFKYSVGDPVGAEIDIISNHTHDEKIIDNMMTNVISMFETDKYKGCKLISVSYDEDKVSGAEKEYSEENNNEQIIIINFTFKTMKNTTQYFNPNTVYDYHAVYIIRNNNYELINVGF